MCDKSRNTWLCVHWQWNTLEWCQLNALQASPVVHLVTPLSCVSLSLNTQPSVPIENKTVAHCAPLRLEQVRQLRWNDLYPFAINTWCSSDVIWRRKVWPTSSQCLRAPSHYLTQCGFIFNWTHRKSLVKYEFEKIKIKETMTFSHKKYSKSSAKW